MKTHPSTTNYPSVSLWGMRALLVVHDDDKCIPPRVTAWMHDGRRVASGENFDDLCAILSDIELRPYAFPEVPEAFFSEDQMMIISGKAFYALRQEIARRGIVSWSDSKHFHMTDMIETALLAGFCSSPSDPTKLSSDPRDLMVQAFQFALGMFMPGRQVVRAEANTCDLNFPDGDVIPGLHLQFTVAVEIEDAVKIQDVELNPDVDELIAVNYFIVGQPGETEPGFSTHGVGIDLADEPQDDVWRKEFQREAERRNPGLYAPEQDDPSAPDGWHDDDDDDDDQNAGGDAYDWLEHAIQEGEEIRNRVEYEMHRHDGECSMCGRERALNPRGRCSECETVWNS